MIFVSVYQAYAYLAMQCFLFGMVVGSERLVKLQKLPIWLRRLQVHFI